MLYVQQSLGENEELIYIGRFHWMYTLQAIMGIVWGMIGAIGFIWATVYFYQHFGPGFQARNIIGMIREIHPGLRIISFFIFVMGLMRFAQMMVIRASTEIAVTSSRIIYKRGLVARQVGEMSVDRIEGVNVIQSILGRIFDYGRLAVRGMGVGEVVFPPLDRPIAFRKAIEKARIIASQSTLPPQAIGSA
jgi:hypothetical protein